MDKHVHPCCLELPASSLRKVQPFAVDFGGSVIKIVYKAKEQENEDTVKVQLASFSRHEFPEALEFIRANCDFSSATTEYNMTGIGTHEFEKTMAKELNISVKTVWEGECFSQAFTYVIENVAEKDLYFESLEDGEEQHLLQKKIDAYKDLAAKMKIGQLQSQSPNEDNLKQGEGQEPEVHGTLEEETADDNGSIYPCIMAVLGSAFVYNETGSGGELGRSSFTPRGGRMFLGLGSLLTGAKRFEELMDLASRGDDRALNFYSSAITKSSEVRGEEGANDIYEAMSTDFHVFGFGWAVGKDLSDFRREDIAKALLVNFCEDVAISSMNIAEKTQSKHIIVVGSFAQTELPRRMIERKFRETATLSSLRPDHLGAKAITLRTLKSGSHLGALGAMLHGIYWNRQPENA